MSRDDVASTTVRCHYDIRCPLDIGDRLRSVKETLRCLYSVSSDHIGSVFLLKFCAGIQALSEDSTSICFEYLSCI